MDERNGSTVIYVKIVGERDGLVVLISVSGLSWARRYIIDPSPITLSLLVNR